jgi:two-component system sensor histidine kinase/response regulator
MALPMTAEAELKQHRNRLEELVAERTQQPAEAKEAAEEAMPTGEAKARLLRDFPQRSILVVEDEPVNQEIARLYLEDIDQQIDVAADGLQALELAMGKGYDAILMDMQMPRMDGLEATRQIRKLAVHAATPIIAMTANAFAEDKQRCLEAGMSDFLTMPVDPDALYAALLKWVAPPPDQV